MQQCLYSQICLSNQASHGLPTSVVRAEMLTFLRGVFAEMIVRNFKSGKMIPTNVRQDMHPEKAARHLARLCLMYVDHLVL